MVSAILALYHQPGGNSSAPQLIQTHAVTLVEMPALSVETGKEDPEGGGWRTGFQHEDYVSQSPKPRDPDPQKGEQRAPQNPPRFCDSRALVGIFKKSLPKL